MSSLSSSEAGEDSDEVHSLYFEIKSSNDFGRYLVAKEDIDAKTLILAESPLICAPIDDKDVKADTNTVYLFCLACCKQLYPSCDNDEENDEVSSANARNKVHTCSKCAWPVCDKSCERASIHSQNECQFFTNHNIVYPPPHEWLMYKSVMLLRVLLRLKREPTLWNFFDKLEHHTETRHTKDNCVRADEIVLENLEYFTQYLRNGTSSRKTERKHRLPYIDDKGMLHRVIGTLNVNAFCANNSMTKRIARCMFQTASLFAHSCAPNCSWTIEMSLLDAPRPSKKALKQKRKNGTRHSSALSTVSPQIQVYTSIPIKKGEIITIPYSTRNIFFGTLKRQLCMESIGHFICKCQRCMSPTELGTFMSAIRCFKCEVGFLVSSDPSNEESLWICTATRPEDSVCGNSCNVRKVVYFVSLAQDQIDRVMGSDFEWFEEQKELQRLFDKHYGSDLHKNHYLLHEISTRIVELLEERLDELRSEDVTGEFETLLSRLEFHVNYLLTIANVILPGYNNYQDQLKFYKEEVMSLKSPELPNGSQEIHL